MDKKIIIMALVLILETAFIGYVVVSDIEVNYLKKYSDTCNDIFMNICFDNESQYYKFDLTIGEYNKCSYDIAELLRYPGFLSG